MIRFKPHSDKQERCIFSLKKFVILACGIQFGKTTVGAMRTKLAMHKHTDPSDNFIIAAPTYKIMQQATLPEFLKWMRGYGEYSKGDACFKMHNGGTCYMRTATDPDSVVGITNVRHIWADEAGLFPLYFHENLQARASFKQAPICYTTSPYSLNWIYTDYIRPRLKDPNFMTDEFELVQARSDENPYFPRDELERKRATMDPRRFNMIYGGQFHKLEGLVYDCFNEDIHVVEPKALPEGTIYVAGVDWGYTHPAVIMVLGITPKDGIYLVAEHYKTQQTIADMVDQAKRLKHLYGITRFYCDPSSPANIAEFNKAKLTAIGADNDIRAGIDAVYDLIKQDKFHVFRNRCPNFLDEIAMYHYPNDENLTPDKDSKDRLPVKQNDHACLDAKTLISTRSTLKPIKDVKVGDEVLTPLGYKRVTASEVTGEKEVFRYRFGNNYIDMTDDHPVHIGGDLAFDKVRYADMFTVCDTKGKNTILMGAIGGALTLKALAQSTFIGRFIKSITEKYRRATTSIIKTMISKITISPILSLSRHPSTYPSMASLSVASHYQKTHWKLQPSGIEAKREELGTLNMARECLENAKPKTISARFAKSRTRVRSMPMAQDFARMRASQSIDAYTNLTMWLENAPIVGRLFKLANIAQPKRVAVHAPVSLGVKKVYNLRVEGAGCYFANGVLVSNCDAIRYPLLALKQANNFNLKAPVEAGNVPITSRMHVQDKIVFERTEEYDW